MKIIVKDSKDCYLLFKNSVLPNPNDFSEEIEVEIDSPECIRFTNMFLYSNLNARVTVKPPSEDTPFVVYSGMFSMCKNLSHQPFMDTSKCVAMSAMFKGCESMRFSVNFLNTSKCRDMRQMFWGCTNFSGNGIQSFDFSSLANENSMRNFIGGGAGIKSVYYDKVIENLYNQAKAGTLPTPMKAVEFGTSQYSPYYKDMRQFVIDYGWEILDGGPTSPVIDESKWVTEFREGVAKRVKNGDAWLDDVDMSCQTRSSQGGILISPRHMLYTYHWKPGVGKKVVFWNGQEGIVESVDITPSVKGWGDMVLVRLREAVKDANPVLFLQRDWHGQCPLLGTYGPPSPFQRMMRPPVIWLDQRDNYHISEVSFLLPLEKTNKVVVVTPENPEFLSRYKNAITGDSGSPACYLYNKKFVLSHLVTYGGAGVGFNVNEKNFREWLEDEIGKFGDKLSILGEINEVHIPSSGVI